MSGVPAFANNVAGSISSLAYRGSSPDINPVEAADQLQAFELLYHEQLTFLVVG